MANTQLVHEMREFREEFRDVLTDLYNIKENIYDPWLQDKPFVDPAHHVDTVIETSAPAAGDLNPGEIRFGDGTGPGGSDELFWSTDGQTVARVEADSIIS